MPFFLPASRVDASAISAVVVLEPCISTYSAVLSAEKALLCEEALNFFADGNSTL